MAGHSGIAKTLELTTRTFWWPNMKKDIEKYIKACHECQISKPDRQPQAAPLQPNEIPLEPWAIKKVISDRGSQFVSGFMKGLYQNLRIEANPSTAYHLQTDGQTERVNQELEEYLRIYVNEQQNDWVDWLPIAQFCHNDRSHSATGFSPFMITTG
jgi:transposase InsO family protein